MSLSEESDRRRTPVARASAMRRLARRAARWAAGASLAGALAASAQQPIPPPGPTGPPPFEIRIVDEESGRGVPLVELRTVDQRRFVTDSAGRIAFADRELSGQRVFFHVRSHGYEFPADGFGMRGRAVEIAPGGSTEWRIRRLNVAERACRLTGAGIYADSLALGRPVPPGFRPLNGGVIGCDSIQSVLHEGRHFWFWGDTNRASYPLGNFHMTGATTPPPDPAIPGSHPRDGFLAYDYFVGDDGFVRGVAQMPGDGPTWLSGLVSLPDASGTRRLGAFYVKIRPPLEAYRSGLCVWNPAANAFEHLRDWPDDAPIRPEGHVFVHPEGDREFAWFGDPYAHVRVEASFEAWQDPESYESYGCLAPGSRAPTDGEATVVRDADGRPDFAWRRDAPPADQALEDALVEAGLLERSERLVAFRDVASGRRVRLHRGSTAWNPFLRQWIMIAVEQGGTSMLGEVWFARAERPEGPWRRGVKILTHDTYSFYNPRHLPAFDEEGGRIVWFEGTYTSTFSGNTDPTPRYDYNQVAYRLDLDDPRLAPAGETD